MFLPVTLYSRADGVRQGPTRAAALRPQNSPAHGRPLHLRVLSQFPGRRLPAARRSVRAGD